MMRFPGYVAALALVVCVVGCQQSPAPAPAPPAATPAPAAAPQEPAGPSRIELIETLKSKALEPRAAGEPAAAQSRGNSLLPVLQEAKAVAGEVQRLDQEYAELQVKAKAHLEVVARHNANRCTYPDGHPEVCADYARRAAVLNTESTRLWNAMDGNEKAYKTATESLLRMKPRLRVAALLDGNCTAQCGGDLASAMACLNACFDGANPRLRSCLNINEPAPLAACLLPL